ncbi:hypothetical protein N8590_00265 [bacterium]|nr:hypothetical protein [bacterium]
MLRPDKLVTVFFSCVSWLTNRFDAMNGEEQLVVQTRTNPTG